jgi:hypothetical protein
MIAVSYTDISLPGHRGSARSEYMMGTKPSVSTGATLSPRNHDACHAIRQYEMIVMVSAGFFMCGKMGSETSDVAKV